jgi:hypothetical protein
MDHANRRGGKAEKHSSHDPGKPNERGNGKHDKST